MEDGLVDTDGGTAGRCAAVPPSRRGLALAQDHGRVVLGVIRAHASPCSGKAEHMNVKGISWAGIRTDQWSETVNLLEHVLGLRRSHAGQGMVAFEAANGDTIEVFTTDEPEHQHFTTGPVVGFQVEDVGAALVELTGARIDTFGGVQRGGGYAWVHFRGPDGTVWELTSSE